MPICCALARNQRRRVMAIGRWSLVAVLATHCALGAQMTPRFTILLSGNAWRLAGYPVGEGEKRGIQRRADAAAAAIAVTVPNDVQLTPFVKDPLGQAADLAGVNGKEWWYTTRFRSPSVDRSRQVRLVFAGVDYFADVWLNGVKLGTHEGAYTRFEYDISDRLSRNGSNYLAVRVMAPWKVPGRSSPVSS